MSETEQQQHNYNNIVIIIMEVKSNQIDLFPFGQKLAIFKVK